MRLPSGYELNTAKLPRDLPRIARKSRHPRGLFEKYEWNYLPQLLDLAATRLTDFSIEHVRDLRGIVWKKINPRATHGPAEDRSHLPPRQQHSNEEWKGIKAEVRRVLTKLKQVGAFQEVRVFPSKPNWPTRRKRHDRNVSVPTLWAATGFKPVRPRPQRDDEIPKEDGREQRTTGVTIYRATPALLDSLSWPHAHQEPPLTQLYDRRVEIIRRELDSIVAGHRWNVADLFVEGAIKDKLEGTNRMAGWYRYGSPERQPTALMLPDAVIQEASGERTLITYAGTTSTIGDRHLYELEDRCDQFNYRYEIYARE